ncbi:MAG: aldo/keto reductase [Alphaproteobacteria bacterium]
MQYVNLGRSGLRVSRLALGCMNWGSKTFREFVLDEDEARAVIRKALDLGINYFDTSDFYGSGDSETILGRALKDMASRESVVIATKVYSATGPSVMERGLSRKHIRHAVDASLRRLQTDYIDLYQLHQQDATTPLEETMEALADLVRAGKVLYVGASNHFAWQLARAIHAADRNGWPRFINYQGFHNLLYREEERETMPLIASEGISATPWSPLARGFLAGNRTRESFGDTLRAKTDKRTHSWFYTDADFAIVDRVKEVAARIGVTPAQIAIAWLLHDPRVAAPIVGVSRPDQLEGNVAALSVKLTREDCAYMEEPYVPRKILGMGLSTEGAT